jgi:GDP-L-fucose synthase
MSNKIIFVSGQEGMVGSSVCRLLDKKNIKYLKCSRKELDLTNQEQVKKYFKKHYPNVIINCAGRVGGILENSLKKDKFLNDNLLIGFNLINASLEIPSVQFINLGSACIYPKNPHQPIKEEYLLTGKLEETNEGYAIAKIATLKYCQYLKENQNKNFISLQPTNLYGFNDNYDLKSSHVIPALIRKFYDAVLNKKNIVEVWGNSNTSRDFLFADDLADFIVYLIGKKLKYSYLNVGSGREVTITELVKLIKKVTGYKGNVIYQKNMPAGQKRRILDIRKLKKIGWFPKNSLESGLLKYYEWFKYNYDN